MKERFFKLYGRIIINKLDWLIGIVSCVIAIGSLWMSMGIAIAAAGEFAGSAYLNVLRGLGFIFNGPSSVISVLTAIIVYGSLVLLIVASILLNKKGLKDRIPGLFAEFVGAIGLVFFLSFAHEYLLGSGAGSVSAFWPISLYVFSALLCGLMLIALYMTLNTKVNIKLNVDMKGKQIEEKGEEAPEEAEEAQPEPEQPEEKPEEVHEEPAVEEPAVEEAVVEESPEVAPVVAAVAESEEPKAEEPKKTDESFAAYGKRRKRIPFENLINKLDDDTVRRYKEIVDALNQYDFNDRLSIPGETFSYKKERLIYITLAGQTLKVHFKLDPKAFADSPIPVKDASGTKKYDDIPVYLKVKSDLAVKRVILLGNQVAEENNVPKK